MPIISNFEMVQNLLLLLLVLFCNCNYGESFTCPVNLATSASSQQGQTTRTRTPSFTSFLVTTTSSISCSKRSSTSTNLASISFQKGKKREFGASSSIQEPTNRFDKTAASETAMETPCILTIQGKQYNMTAWAKSHPGGSRILEKFHNRDATKAFFAAGHSQYAIDMLNDFLIKDEEQSSKNIVIHPHSSSETLKNALETVGSFDKSDEKGAVISRVRTKLFTKEDPIGIHKYCGIFVLLHFAFRFLQSFFGDPSAGMGHRLGKGSSLISLACIIPHTVLSLSSLIFHTVPRERIVGRPMIVSAAPSNT